MDVVCDTNIWYYLSDGSIDPESLSITEHFVVTFNTMEELSRTFHLVKNEEKVRSALKIIKKFSNKTIFEPPFEYITKLAVPSYQWDVKKNFGQILEFNNLIEQGYSIKQEKLNELKMRCQRRLDDLQLVSDFFNDEATKIQERIVEKTKHRKMNSLPIVKEFISFFVSHITQTEKLPNDFKWEKIELLLQTLIVYFKELETTEMKSKPNDWFDVFLLSYVQPGSKVWTVDKRLKELIRKAKMNKYIYNGDSNPKDAQS